MNHKMKRTLIYPYIPAMVNRLEKWLKNKANEGWKLIEKRHCFFVFQKCAPYEGEYLLYSGFDASKGLSFDYHMAKMKYGKAKSELNKSPEDIFEVDITKEDAEFFRFKKLRNTYYFRHYVTLAIFSIIALVSLLLVTMYEAYVIYLVFICLLLVIYALISLMIIKRDVRASKDS